MVCSGVVRIIPESATAVPSALSDLGLLIAGDVLLLVLLVQDLGSVHPDDAGRLVERTGYVI